MSANNTGASGSAPVIRFRNYQPRDATLTQADKGIGIAVAAPAAPSVVAKQEAADEAAQALAEKQVRAGEVWTRRKLTSTDDSLCVRQPHRRTRR